MHKISKSANEAATAFLSSSMTFEYSRWCSLVVFIRKLEPPALRYVVGDVVPAADYHFQLMPTWELCLPKVGARTPP